MLEIWGFEGWAPSDFFLEGLSPPRIENLAPPLPITWQNTFDEAMVGPALDGNSRALLHFNRDRTFSRLSALLRTCDHENTDFHVCSCFSAAKASRKLLLEHSLDLFSVRFFTIYNVLIMIRLQFLGKKLSRSNFENRAIFMIVTQKDYWYRKWRPAMICKV